MVEALVDAQSLVWIHGEHQRDQLFRRLAHPAPFAAGKAELGLHDLADHGELLAVPKGWEASQQGVEDDATGPHVHPLTVALACRPLNHARPGGIHVNCHIQLPKTAQTGS